MRDLENLRRALASFREDMWLPFEDSIGCIKLDIANAMIDREKLKRELDSSIKDPDFDWIKLAGDTRLLISPSDYTNIEVLNYVKWLIKDYLFPERVISESRINKLYLDTIIVLKEYANNDGWLDSYQLYDILKLNKDYHAFEYYNLWKLDFSKEIERKPYPSKDRALGRLRYKVRK